MRTLRVYVLLGLEKKSRADSVGIGDLSPNIQKSTLVVLHLEWDAIPWQKLSQLLRLCSMMGGRANRERGLVAGHL